MAASLCYGSRVRIRPHYTKSSLASPLIVMEDNMKKGRACASWGCNFDEWVSLSLQAEHDVIGNRRDIKPCMLCVVPMRAAIRFSVRSSLVKCLVFRSLHYEVFRAQIFNNSQAYQRDFTGRALPASHFTSSLNQFAQSLRWTHA